MKEPEVFGEEKLKRLELFIYLIPVIGLFPALWRLYRPSGDRQQQSVSRVSVTLALIWLIAYSLIWLGATQTSEILTFRLLYASGLLTSGYFLVCISLMVRLWQGKSLRLPVISKISEKIARKNTP